MEVRPEWEGAPFSRVEERFDDDCLVVTIVARLLVKSVLSVPLLFDETKGVGRRVKGVSRPVSGSRQRCRLYR